MGARIEIEYSDIEKVTDCSELNKEINNLIVFLRLNNMVSMNSREEKIRNLIFSWAYELLNDNAIETLANSCDDDTYSAVELQVDKIFKKLESALVEFKTNTDIQVYFDYDFEKEKIYFELRWEDIFAFTPKVATLDNMNVDFSLITYDDD